MKIHNFIFTKLTGLLLKDPISCGIIKSPKFVQISLVAKAVCKVILPIPLVYDVHLAHLLYRWPKVKSYHTD